MAQLAISLAGAAVSTGLGFGPKPGWLIGTIIGRLLFPGPGPEDQFHEGPRMGDLTITSSSEGAFRHILYGTARLNGNIIWATEVEEVKNVQTEEIGGKGMMSQTATSTTVSYSYFASFDVAFCEGVIDEVLRIWADSKVIYDRTGASDFIIKEGVTIRFYPGSEDQLPDSLIVQDKGAANTPAARGTCHIMFDRLPLKDFGHVPNINAELTANVTRTHNSWVGDPIDNSPAGTFNLGEFTVDWDRGYLYTVGSGDPNNWLRRFNLRTMVEDRQEPTEAIFDPLSGVPGWAITGPMAVMSDGIIIACAGGLVAQPIITIDPDTWLQINKAGTESGGSNWGPNRYNDVAFFAPVKLFDPYGTFREFIFMGSALPGFEAVGIVTYPYLDYVWDSDTWATDGDPTFSIQGSAIYGGCVGVEGEGVSELWFVSWTTDNVYIYRITLSIDAASEVIDTRRLFRGVDIALVDTIHRTVIGPSQAGTLFGGVGPIYDRDDGGLIMHTIFTTGTHVWKWREGEGLVWETEITSGQTGPPSRAIQTNSQVICANGTYGFVTLTNGKMFDTRTGEITVDTTFVERNHVGGGSIWNSYQETVVGQDNQVNGIVSKFIFNRYSGGDEVVANVITDLCARVGIPAQDIDVSDLTDDIIPGFVISRPTSARAPAQQLEQAYIFNGVESDWILKWPQRPKSIVRTITQDELMETGNNKEFWVENRIQEIELPERFSVTYMDRIIDYQQGVESAKRMRVPNPTMHSRNQVGLEIPAVFTPVFSKRLAETLLFSAWIERDNYGFSLGWKHLELDPTDSITVNLDNGATFRARIVSTDIGAGLMMECNALSEDSAMYTSTVSAADEEGFLPSPIHEEGVTRWYILDVPLLRDTDEPPSRAFNPLYYFMGGVGQSGWLAATLFKSSDDRNWTPVGRTIGEMGWGTTVLALADPNPSVHGTDYESELRVSMIAGDDRLASITYAQMMDGSNPCAVIKANGEIEILQYQTVTLNNDGTYSLTVLTRGRRGSDTMAFNHTFGEIFIMLESSTGDLFTIELSEVDVLRYYRALSAGEVFEDVDSTQLTAEGRALMPYAPTQVTAVEDGSNNIDLAWLRRTRIGGPWKNLSAGIPLNEDSEEYEIDIYDHVSVADPTPTAIVRTVTSLSSPAYEYTQANIQADLTPFTEYLLPLLNYSAENGTSNWTVVSGGLGTKQADNVISPYHGANFFYGGANAATEVYQDLDVSAWATEIDAGDAQFLCGWFQSSLEGDDTGRINLEFFNASMVSQGTSNGTLDAPARLDWTFKSNSAAIPTTTRTVRVTMDMVRTTGTDLDAYFDFIQCSIGIDSLVPNELRVAVYQISAQVGRGFANIHNVRVD